MWNPTNSTSPTMSTVPPALSPIMEWWRPLLYPVFAAYAVVCTLGVAGNLVVMYIVLAHPSMHTITNLFIVNLAISDILMSLVAAPITPLATSWRGWHLPTALCKFFPMTMGVSVYVSTLTCTAIAVNRYYVTVRPGFTKMTPAVCGGVVLVTWAVATLISLPLGVYQNSVVQNTTNETSCRETWPKEASRETFTMVNFLLQFVAPGSIITVCYWKISVALRKQYLANTLAISATQHSLVRKQRTNCMLILMMVVFVCCWIPLNLWWIVMDFVVTKYFPNTHDHIHEDVLLLVFYVCHLLAMSSAVYNPFIYIYMNENFKREFRRVVLSCWRVLGRREVREYGEELCESSQRSLQSQQMDTTVPRRQHCRQPPRETKHTDGEERLAMKRFPISTHSPAKDVRQRQQATYAHAREAPLQQHQNASDVFYIDSRGNTTVHTSMSSNGAIAGQHSRQLATSPEPSSTMKPHHHLNDVDEAIELMVLRKLPSTSTVQAPVIPASISSSSTSALTPRIVLTDTELTGGTSTSPELQFVDDSAGETAAGDEAWQHLDHSRQQHCQLKVRPNKLSPVVRMQTEVENNEKD